MSFMDAAFMLNEEARTNFLQHLTTSLRASYIILWLYSYQSNSLGFWGGYYNEDQENNNNSGGTSNTVARRLQFDVYGQSIFYLETTTNGGGSSHVPGLAFKKSLPYVELTHLQLQTFSSSLEQQQFYQDARVKKAIFMGCTNGEIELGFRNETQANMEIEIRNWFREYLPMTGSDLPPPPPPPPRSSSNSSSLRSSSMDSPESTPLLFNNIPTPILAQQHAVADPGIAAILAFAQQQQSQLMPRGERENAAMTQALLHVFSSSHLPSSSSTSEFSHHLDGARQNPRASAFRNYSPSVSTSQMRGRTSMFKRAISYYNIWNMERRQQMAAGRPSATQLHHMISERRRREKLNESFQALRSLLPPGTKKDKGSVLTSTRDYLSSLKAQVAELTRRNQLLEAKNNLSPAKKSDNIGGEVSLSKDKFSVRLARLVSESTSENVFDLHVIVNNANCPNVELMIRILEFLREARNVTLMSMEAMAESTLGYRAIIFRLVFEGNEWDDQPAFVEAIRRIVGDIIS
ncbi:hypothetical protein ACFE04_017271 [Oxalis oulophora]